MTIERAEAALAALRDTLAPLQAAHLATRGRYRQLGGPRDFAAAGVDYPADCAARVDVYEGPRGHGWVLVCSFAADGETREKAVNAGAEAYRDHDWRARATGEV